ncbi:hypothetical protein GCM10022235_53350 [Kribbella ginsengisoli]|uniref:Uncharacterized protein n=1 Tax=Kribbella ginsengisoli TaxID=363865 RepID=A0ABP6Y3N4_9ACTN
MQRGLRQGAELGQVIGVYTQAGLFQQLLRCGLAKAHPWLSCAGGEVPEAGVGALLEEHSFLLVHDYYLCAGHQQEAVTDELAELPGVRTFEGHLWRLRAVAEEGYAGAEGLGLH